ncbi:MAG TPA: L-threonylcarbamoyladenylate synthase, partial [Flavisolibacter sp.]|nr:L-threonylcarbamoyladenylate synthase [Flavisolibacter sp.]
MMNAFEKDIEESLRILKEGGVLLYPTDTIWGLGCDATDAEAVKRIYNIKKRDDSKTMIILVADERELMKHVAAPDPQVFDFIEQQTRPTTIIFDNVIGLPGNLLAEDGSIAIRMVRDEFCRHLIKRLRHPIVSTSANISGQPSPKTFDDISIEVKN